MLISQTASLEPCVLEIIRAVCAIPAPLANFRIGPILLSTNPCNL